MFLGAQFSETDMAYILVINFDKECSISYGDARYTLKRFRGLFWHDLHSHRV
jgi:hypothetical protein